MAVAPGELLSALKEFTGGLGVDYVFECTGQAGVWEDSVHYVRRGGTVILFGGCKSGTRVSYDAYRLHYDEITLKGVFHFTPRDVKTAYGLLQGPINVSTLISGSYPLKDLGIPFEKLSRGEGIKYAVIP
jgi:L-iditol 2-dehydrogenase